MTTKLEALRLADAIDPFVRPYAPDHLTSKVAAAELRRLYAENEALRNVANRGGHIAVAMSRIDQLEAQRDALLEALKPMIDLAEFWINHRQERRVSEEQYNVWIALGHESSAMLKARAAIKAVEETK